MANRNPLQAVSKEATTLIHLRFTQGVAAQRGQPPWLR
jgi:hypothetical protein